MAGMYNLKAVVQATDPSQAKHILSAMFGGPVNFRADIVQLVR